MAEARRTAELAQQRSREAAEEAREPTSLAEVKYEMRDYNGRVDNTLH